jgi:hypothetical protein
MHLFQGFKKGSSAESRSLMIELNRDNLKTVADSSQPLEDMWERVRIIRDLATKADNLTGQQGHYTIPDAVTLTLVIQAMRDDGGYKAMIDSWCQHGKTFRTATDAWTKFVEHCDEREEERLRVTTAGSEGFAGKTTVVTPPGRAMPTNADDATKQDNTSARRKIQFHEVEGTKIYYCWTHGICYHASPQCKIKANGHSDAATLLDRKGGSEAVARSILEPNNMRKKVKQV